MNKRQRLAEENHQLLQLWHRSQEGDHVAFRDLADRLYRRLFNYAFNFTRDRDFIKDTIQDLLISVWRKREKIEIEVVLQYFLRAMRNQLFQHFRRGEERDNLLNLDGFQEISDEDYIEKDIIDYETYIDNAYRLRVAVDELPRRQKEVVFLKYYEGMENDKIAELLQINRQSVANLLFKAVVRLKEQLQGC